MCFATVKSEMGSNKGPEFPIHYSIVHYTYVALMAPTLLWRLLFIVPPHYVMGVP